MLSIPVRTISQGAVQVNAELSPADAIWTENDVRPVEGVRVTGRLNGAGAGLDACTAFHPSMGDIAADHGTVHRDITPANVLYDRDKKRATLIDFNIA
jgi:hypothetical protein